MRKISEIVSIVMILTVLFAIIPAFAITPHDANSMWVEPGTNTFNTATTNVGFTFNVTMYANVSSCPGAKNAIGGWQFKLLYNTSQLNATERTWYANLTAGKSDIFWNIPTTQPAPVFDHAIGSVLAGEVWAGNPTTGPWAICPRLGGLMIVELQIIAAPPKGGNLTSLLDISTGFSTGDTYILDYDSGDDIGETIYNANYEYDWTTPPSPYIAISPTSSTFGPFANVTGTTFTETITLKSLSAAWYITNVSLTLNYAHVPNILVVSGVALNTIAWNVAATFDNTTYGALGIYVETDAVSPPLSGDVLIATVTFTIIYQGLSPETNTVPLTFSDEMLFDHTRQITPGNDVPGSVTVNGLVAAPLAWLELIPHTQTFGPDPVIGTTFHVEVWIMNLSSYWQLVGLEYKINYDPTVLGVVDVAEGPYLPSFPQGPPYDPPFTWFISFVQADGFGPNILVGELLLPADTTPIWPGPFPGGVPPAVENGLIADITFQILQQGTGFPPTNITTALTFIKSEILLLDVNGNELLMLDPVNATVTILSTIEVGRAIDEYAGASNSGQWAGYPNPFPAPYGGQGPNVPMDIVEPQSEITFYANVTYNFWPVQSKDVGFELEGPFVKLPNGTLVPDQTYQIWFKLTARTDSNGIARITVRMPWPCVNPESITGIYRETSTVQLADITLTDTITFYYQHMVYITKVTASPYYVYHDEMIHVCVDYETHSMQTYPVLFAVVLQDELGVPFGQALVSTTFGGAQWCTWTTGKFCVDVYVPKWAYSGFTYVHVSAYNKDPTIGGFSYGMEYTPLPEVYILPTTPPTVYITPVSATWNMTGGIPITFTAHVSGGVPPYTYEWYMDGFLQPGTGNTFTIYSWAAGTHTVSVAIADYFGRTATSIVTLIVIA
jgi:hypothetical protein